MKSQGWAVKPVTDPDVLTYLATILTVEDGSQLGKGHDVNPYHRNYNDMELFCAWQISHPNKKMIYNACRAESLLKGCKFVFVALYVNSHTCSPKL